METPFKQSFMRECRRKEEKIVFFILVSLLRLRSLQRIPNVQRTLEEQSAQCAVLIKT